MLPQYPTTIIPIGRKKEQIVWHVERFRGMEVMIVESLEYNDKCEPDHWLLLINGHIRSRWFDREEALNEASRLVTHGYVILF
jgi:hypothetical protein